VSLDAPIADDTTTTLHDRLADDAPEYEERHARAAAAPELASALATATAGLGERERFIVAHRLLADVEARLTLEEIGKHFGFTRERARQLELRLKTSLRERLSAVVERHALSSAA
jgi:RNA polymerase sigma-32 factor